MWFVLSNERVINIVNPCIVGRGRDTNASAKTSSEQAGLCYRVVLHVPVTC